MYSARKIEWRRPKRPEITPKTTHLYLFDLKIEMTEVIKKEIAKIL
jgi:hypothetical protein